MNYFDIYKIILETINESDPHDFQQLLYDSQNKDVIKKHLEEKPNDQQLIKEMLRTTENMINDGLVVGTVTPTKRIKLIKLDGLTTTGHSYLKALNDKKFLNKLKKTIKDNAIPLTYKAITGAILKFIL